MKLYEMPNTVVHLKTQEEYDEYMRMCEEVGWYWCDDRIPSGYNYFGSYENLCVTITSQLTFCHKDFYEKKGYIVLTFTELLKALDAKEKHSDHKTSLEFKEFHPYLVYVLLENEAKPEIIDGEIGYIFYTDNFLIRVVGETHNFEVQFGVKKTFDRWGNSVDFTFSLEITEDDSFETIQRYVDNKLMTISELYSIIPDGFFNDPCLKISV